MIIGIVREWLRKNRVAPEERYMDAEYEPFRDRLAQVGLSEKALRNMKPDERVAALENARLDPYDYIYLAC